MDSLSLPEVQCSLSIPETNKQTNIWPPCPDFDSFWNAAHNLPWKAMANFCYALELPEIVQS